MFIRSAQVIGRTSARNYIAIESEATTESDQSANAARGKRGLRRQERRCGPRLALVDVGLSVFRRFVRLVVGKNKEALRAKRTYPHGNATRVECCGILKKDALRAVLHEHHYTGVIVGVRRDEEPTRAKERYFSPRDKHMEWNVEDQPPELWNQFKTDFEPGTHIRIHPLLHWTELNIWEYIERESVPVIPLYFANAEGKRYRSIGCYPCTFPIPSQARTVHEIVEELRHNRTPERAGRAQDQESEDAFEKLRRDGYM